MNLKGLLEQAKQALGDGVGKLALAIVMKLLQEFFEELRAAGIEPKAIEELSLRDLMALGEFFQDGSLANLTKPPAKKPVKQAAKRKIAAKKGSKAKKGAGSSTSPDNAPAAPTLAEPVPGVSLTSLDRLWPLFWQHGDKEFPLDAKNRYQALGFPSDMALGQAMKVMRNQTKLLVSGAKRGDYRFVPEQVPPEWREARAAATA